MIKCLSPHTPVFHYILYFQDLLASALIQTAWAGTLVYATQMTFSTCGTCMDSTQNSGFSTPGGPTQTNSTQKGCLSYGPISSSTSTPPHPTTSVRFWTMCPGPR